MNLIYKGVILFTLCLTSLGSVFAATTPTRVVGTLDVKNNILPDTTPGSDAVIPGGTDMGFSTLDGVLEFIKTSVFSLMLLIGVGVFLFIGIRLVMARGNEEEFKKALLHFVYAVIGIFVVSASWAVVKLVTGITF